MFDLTKRLAYSSLLLLAAWCGLCAGLLEVMTVVLRKELFDPDHFYAMSRHFLWLVPLVNLCVFLALGLLGCIAVFVWPRGGERLVIPGLIAVALLPALLVAFPQIYGFACLIVAIGVAAHIARLAERSPGAARRIVLLSLPAAAFIVATLAASLALGDWKRQSRENARPLPPPGSPNVLLIVMDTVAADHLSLHGYHRPTSPTLVELSQRAIRFDSARAASSWTLPSHANMFTGRWMHELTVGWLTPLDRARPTLAEYLGQHGYATAGFVGNTTYCAVDSGLARGFTHYADHVFPELTAFKMSALVSRTLKGYQAAVSRAENWLDSAGLSRYARRLWRSLDFDRKGAALVNREFLDWLARRAQPDRPFFAFLNYADAHHPYELLPGRLHRFGDEPPDRYHRLLIQDWWQIDKSALPSNDIAFAAALYDDCIADLDEQLGKFLDELDARGVRAQTWLIVTSDHGESFGEHAGVFCHGKSLYESELHVPLLVVPPGGAATNRVVSEPVSLRDLAATIADVAGLKAGAPFPGVSLAECWKRPAREISLQPPSPSPALAEMVPNNPPARGALALPKQLPPLGALKEAGWSYIRREGYVREELFHLTEDVGEKRDLSSEPATRPTLERMRQALDRLTGGALSPERFSH